MTTKQEQVLEKLRETPMTVNELCDIFWPRISYAYLKTMMNRLYKQGLLDVACVEKITMHQGGSREVYRYMVRDTVPNDEDILPIRRQVVVKGKNSKPVLTHPNLKIETLKELVMKQNPLFVMYMGTKYL